jgi:O-antigen/teichoic acid export membrane protein
LGPELFTWVFGESWRMAGRLTQVMAVMFYLKFVVSPLTHTYLLAGRQREDLWMHGYILASSVGALWLGWRWTGSAEITLLSFAVNFGTIYMFYLWRSRRFAGGGAQ